MLPTFACRCQSTAGTASSCLGGRMSASLLTFGDSRLSFSRSRDAKCAHQTDDRRSRSRHSRRARVAITIATSGLKRHADAAVSSLEACPTPALRSESAPASCYARAGIRQPLTNADNGALTDSICPSVHAPRIAGRRGAAQRYGSATAIESRRAGYCREGHRWSRDEHCAGAVGSLRALGLAAMRPGLGESSGNLPLSTFASSVAQAPNAAARSAK